MFLRPVGWPKANLLPQSSMVAELNQVSAQGKQRPKSLRVEFGMIPVREGCSRPATQAARSYGILPCVRLCIDPGIWLPSDWQPSINYSPLVSSWDLPRNTPPSTASWNWSRIGRAETVGDASASCERPSSRHWTTASHPRNQNQVTLQPPHGRFPSRGRLRMTIGY